MEGEDAGRLKVGDVVNLNSGSPDLTVSAIGSEGTKADVSWIKESGEVAQSTFPIACLRYKKADGLATKAPKKNRG
jgi:uncharacterized protein YodC (DUF2158 family)